MAQLTVRNVDDDLVRRLKLRAAEKNRSAEAEHRAILEEALRSGTDAFWNRAAKLRAKLHGRAFADSAAVIRRERTRRSGLAR